MNILKVLAAVAGFGLAIYVLCLIIGTVLCVGGVIELNQILEPKRQMLNELAKILG